MALRDHFSLLRCAGCGRAGSLVCVRCDASARLVAQPEVSRPRVVARWHYEGAPRALILRTKMSGDLDAAATLAAGMVVAARESGIRADVVTWVPGRTKDIRKRGFDHAAVLAQGVAGPLGLPFRPLVRRVADPPDQTGLGAAARRRNLEGAFVAGEEALEGRRVVIVDDLVTTGSTLLACASALSSACPRSVEGLVACAV